MPKTSQAPTSFRKKVDRLWATLFLTQEGKPKSAKLLYTFCLSLVFLLVYGLCYWFLIDILEQTFAAASTFIRNLLEAVLPGLAGSILCGTFFFVFKDKSYLPVIYTWILVFALAVLVSLLLLTDRGSLGMMLGVYSSIVLTGLVSGSVFSWYMYIRWKRRRNVKN